MLTADVQYCGTPGCCGILNKNVKEEDMFPADRRGFELEICSCGATACMKCKKKAHVGLSCSEYSKIENDIQLGTLLLNQ